MPSEAVDPAHFSRIPRHPASERQPTIVIEPF
jgi:hypothetical protein